MRIEQTYTTSPEQLAIIIADAHIPLDDRPGATADREAFRTLLASWREKGKLLILLGDIFDFWYEWRYVIPKSAFGILRECAKWVENGAEVHYFAGNHDFKFGPFFSEEIGFRIHMDDWSAEINRQKIWFHHGDGMANWDVNYRRMKTVFRNPTAQLLFGNIIHPDLAMLIGKMASQAGRGHHQRASGGIPPDDAYIRRAQSILDEGYDGVVMGHSHRNRTVELNGGWFYNPGPFQNERRYSILDGTIPRSEVWA